MKEQWDSAHSSSLVHLLPNDGNKKYFPIYPSLTNRFLNKRQVGHSHKTQRFPMPELSNAVVKKSLATQVLC